MTRRYFTRAAAAREAPKPPRPQLVAPAAPEPMPPREPLDLTARQVLYGPEVARLLGVSLATFHQRRRSGTWPLPELLPRLDRRPRFARATVEAYLRGELVVVRGRRSA